MSLCAVAGYAGLSAAVAVGCAFAVGGSSTFAGIAFDTCAAVGVSSTGAVRSSRSFAVIAFDTCAAVFVFVADTAAICAFTGVACDPCSTVAAGSTLAIRSCRAFSGIAGYTDAAVCICNAEAIRCIGTKAGNTLHTAAAVSISYAGTIVCRCRKGE